MRVSKRALKMIQKEYSKLAELVAKGEQINHSEDCDCEILLQFGIGCRHYLARAFYEGIPIPITLLHPRWWLGGPPIPVSATK